MPIAIGPDGQALYLRDGTWVQAPRATNPDTGETLVFDGEQWTPLPRQEPAKPAYRGSVLPLSRDVHGQVSFDPDAGLLGAIRRAITLPRDVMTGEEKLPSLSGIPGSMLADENRGAMQRAFELAGLATPVSQAARRTLNVPGKPPAPTAEALRQASDQGYAAARSVPIDFSAPEVSKLAFSIKQALEKDGVFDTLAPKTFALLNRLEAPPSGAVATMANLDAARRALQRAAADRGNRTEQYAAERAIALLDDWIGQGPPQRIAKGSPQDVAAATRAIEQARGNYAAAKRSEKIADAQERAELKAAVSHSGQNIDNALRQRLYGILTNPSERAGFSAEEIAQMERAARGTRAANTARYVGNLLGGGGGLGTLLTGAFGAGSGALGGGPLGAIIGAMLPGLGIAGRRLGAKLTEREIERLDEMVRRRSPLYQSLPQTRPVQMATPQSIGLLRSLLLGYPDVIFDAQ